MKIFAFSRGLRVLAAVTRMPADSPDLKAVRRPISDLQGDGSVSRIDPATNRVLKQYFDKSGDALRFGLGSLWLPNHEMQEVWQFDPKGL